MVRHKVAKRQKFSTRYVDVKAGEIFCEQSGLVYWLKLENGFAVTLRGGVHTDEHGVEDHPFDDDAEVFVAENAYFVAPHIPRGSE